MEVQSLLSSQLVLGEMLSRQARKKPVKTAIVEKDLRFTYQELNERVNQLANALSALNIGRGDKVAVMLFNSHEIIECYFALSKLGVLTVPINNRFVGKEVSYILQDSEAKILIFDNELTEVVKQVRQDIIDINYFISVGDSKEDKVLNYEQVIASAPTGEPMQELYDSEPAFIMYTSGTTGRPKGAVLTHKSKTIHTVNCIIELGLQEDDKYLCVPPLFHTASLAVMLMMVFLGGTTVLVRQFEPSTVTELAQREQVTLTFLVPVMWNALLMVPEVSEKLKSLNTAITGAAIMPLSLKEKVLESLPGVGLVDAFGQTEMSPVTTLLKSRDTVRKGTSVGQPVINVETRVVDDKGQDVRIGEIGEIIYRGPTMFKEYYRNPEATSGAIKNGWFYSGDLVRMDEEGFIYVVDRKKDMIISGGENVYPAEVEEVLYRHDKVMEVAVVGVPDEKWGERVHAVIVPRPGVELTEEEIANWCNTF